MHVVFFTFLPIRGIFLRAFRAMGRRFDVIAGTLNAEIRSAFSLQSRHKKNEVFEKKNKNNYLVLEYIPRDDSTTSFPMTDNDPIHISLGDEPEVASQQQQQLLSCKEYMQQHGWLQKYAALRKQEKADTDASIRPSLLPVVPPADIIRFWYGCACHDTSNLQRGGPLLCMISIWFGGDPLMDEVCQTLFTDTIRVVAQIEDNCNQGWTPKSNQNNDSGYEEDMKISLEAWTYSKESDTQQKHPRVTEADLLAAKLILFDQLPRNAFRGTEEAFAYDKYSIPIARQLVQSFLVANDMNDVTQKTNNSEVGLQGEVYPPYIAFSVVALLHSEEIQDHMDALRVLKSAKQRTPEHLRGFWDMQEYFVLDHTRVVERFGRYPHRNKAKSRTNTPEEQAWLNDVEHLPGWAKSQM